MIRHRSTSKDPPATGDPLVVDGVKYRIRSFDTGGHTGWRRWANLRTSFRPHLTTIVAVDDLTWDRVTGVWRVPS